MRRFTVALLILIIGFSYTVQAADFTKLSGTAYAKVLEVVDGEAFVATLIPSGQLILIRMLGVDSEGNDLAIKYLNNILLGSLVRLEIDVSYRAQVDRWSLAYVYKDNVLINSELLSTGYARLNTSHSNASLISVLKKAQAQAESGKIGVWAEPEQTVGYYSGNAVNINTATASQLSSRLDISISLANRIVSYRDENPFKTVKDIKFVNGFTKEIYDKTKHDMVVCTNINLAAEDELLTLASFTDSDVRSIIEYRSSGRIKDVKLLYSDAIISRSKYNNNLPFISTETVSSINVTIPAETVVNINTASSSQLVNAGFSQSQAGFIVDYRANYSYKTIEELRHIFSFSTSNINMLADNTVVYTNINTAGETELMSLLGSDGTVELAEKLQAARPFNSLSELEGILTESVYNKILPYVYINTNEAVYININTASRQELLNLGLTSDTVSSVIKNQHKIITSKDIPSEIIEYDMKISLFTNINKASRQELMSLGASLTSTIASDIISYRNDQPFGSMDEVYSFFDNKELLSFFDAIEDFIVLR